MANGEPQKAPGGLFKEALASFPQIIEAVRSVLGLSALAILVMALVLWLTPKEAGIEVHLIGVGSILAIFIIALIYTYAFERTDLTFRVRISRLSEGIEIPWAGVCVRLVRNGATIQEKHSSEEGDLFFTLRVRRKDDVSVLVIDPQTNQPKLSPAPIYSEGQFMLIKRILLS
jgi:hypothetical protein